MNFKGKQLNYYRSNKEDSNFLFQDGFLGYK